MLSAGNGRGWQGGRPRPTPSLTTGLTSLLLLGSTALCVKRQKKKYSKTRSFKVLISRDFVQGIF